MKTTNFLVVLFAFATHQATVMCLEKRQNSLQVAVDILNRVNQARNGRSSVCLNTKLMAAALAHSQDQAKTLVLNHIGSDGSSFDVRQKQFGYLTSASAENIAEGQDSAASVMDSWLNSPGHRDNILNPAYNQMGIAFAVGQDGRKYWTQEFGRGDPSTCLQIGNNQSNNYQNNNNNNNNNKEVQDQDYQPKRIAKAKPSFQDQRKLQRELQQLQQQQKLTKQLQQQCRQLQKQLPQNREKLELQCRRLEQLEQGIQQQRQQRQPKDIERQQQQIEEIQNQIQQIQQTRGYGYSTNGNSGYGGNSNSRYGTKRRVCLRKKPSSLTYRRRV